VPEQPDTERTDELAIRLARAHYARMRGELAPFQRLDDMSSGIAGIWRTMALTVQDVLGNEGVAHSMAAMDNLADATSRAVRDERLDAVAPTHTVNERLQRSLGSEP
jgi:hypothetical protein